VKFSTLTKHQAWILLVFCALFWAGNYVFGSYVIQDIPPIWITLLRWSLALLLLFPIARFLENPDWKAAMQSWKPLLAMGILGIIGYNLILYTALEYTSPTNAALVNSLNPAVIVLFSIFLLKERISLLQGVGFGISLIGVLIILTDGNLLQLFHAKYNKGDLWMLLAILVWTLYSIMAKQLEQVPPITATAISALMGILILLPFCLWHGIELQAVSSLALTGIIYMALFPSIGSFIFWNLSVRAIGASQAGIFLNLIPVFTAIISLIVGENITLHQVQGGLLVIAGVLLTTGILQQRFSPKKSSLPT
jgi:drug/metabolite transporter (DMT)-like permease